MQKREKSLLVNDTRPLKIAALWAGLLLVGCFLVMQSAIAQLPDFSSLVKDNEAAVVNISTTSERKTRSNIPGRPGSGDRLEDFYRFFGPPGGNGPRGSQPRNPNRSLGSGFIIAKDGYVLTNNHVVEDADEIIVRTSDRREYEATLVGADPRSDLALLKIESEDDFPILKMGNFDDVEVGQWVLAIGSPFGFDYSVTAGIVSAKGRSLASPRTGNYVPFIQTDVAINPGNSGGPLFNLDGEVVGINSQIYSNSGGFMGVSFAIPIDIAMDVVDQLKENGRVSRGWLGVEILELTRDLAEGFGLDRPQGALVTRVLKDSPAEKGGILDEDIILEFNGDEISQSSELPHFVGRAPVGKASEVLVLREGEKVMLAVDIGELPENPQRQFLGQGSNGKEKTFGLTVGPISPRLARETGLLAGVEVYGTEGVAQAAGFEVGDVIVRMKGVDIDNLEKFTQVIASVDPGQVVPIKYHRGQRAQYLALRAPLED
jgi:serine protease Do